MKERPIIFSGPMVRAILDGRKSQARRVVKPQPVPFHDTASEHHGKPWMQIGGVYQERWECPYGLPGDRLWVRETHWLNTGDVRAGHIKYRADDPVGVYPWRPSIFMRREDSRLTLDVTAVRVERLQDISDEDALAEGVFGDEHPWADQPLPTMCFEALWDSINSKPSNNGRVDYGHPWASNPWVWVVMFKRVEAAP